MRILCIGLMSLWLAACGRIGYEGGELPTDAALPVQGDAPSGDPADASPLDLVGHYLAAADDPTQNAAGAGADGSCVKCPAPVEDSGRDVAFDFSVAEHIEIAHDVRFATDQGFTVALWLEPRSHGQYMTAVGKVFGDSNGNSWKLNNAAEGVDFESFHAGVIERMQAQGRPLPLGAWSHVTLVWDGEMKRLYLDGELLRAEPADISLDDGDIFIGADLDPEGVVYFFDGLLSDVRIYSRPLSEGEIAALAGGSP